MVEERPVHVRLSAVILAVTDEVPRLLTVSHSESTRDALPSGRLEPDADRTLELALRRLVREQAGIELGYAEQLYTFGDRGRDPNERVISVAYMALVREQAVHATESAAWRDGYALLPWEDWRRPEPPVVTHDIVPTLRSWANNSAERGERANIAFGLGGSPWDPTRALDRYELLYEVGLVAERASDLGTPSDRNLGLPMALDHRRMVATALSRIRGKLTYRPVVFELLPPCFTLSQLQRLVEALAGIRLHTPNFRRVVTVAGLVERTGEVDTRTGGRPAEIFRFRREVLRERPAPGLGLPGKR